jgi:hypothetical protein
LFAPSFDVSSAGAGHLFCRHSIFLLPQAFFSAAAGLSARAIALQTQGNFREFRQIDQVLRNFAQPGLRVGRNYQRPVGIFA